MLTERRGEIAFVGFAMSLYLCMPDFYTKLVPYI